ncbi:MAG: M48 family metalloprotease [Myxococcota bacterium]
MAHDTVTGLDLLRAARREWKTRGLSVTSALLLGLLSTACFEKAPEFPLVPTWQEPPGGTAALDEKALELSKEADEAFEEMEDDAFLDRPEIVERLEEVVGRLWPDDGRRPLPPNLRIRISDVVEANAGAWPNGMIVVTAGLLVRMDSEAQAASLLGHELVHALERHSAAEALYAEMTPSHVDRMLLSKELESRADDGAYRLALDAGYAPEAAVGMLRVLAESGDAPTWGRIRAWESHPDLSARIRAMELRAAKESEAGEGRVAADEWVALIDPIRLHVARLAIEARDRAFAEENVESYLERHPGSGRALWTRAEILKRFERGDERDALILAALEDAYTASPDDADVLRALGMELRRRGEDERARDLLARYLAVRPEAIDRRMIERYLGRSVTGMAE